MTKDESEIDKELTEALKNFYADLAMSQQPLAQEFENVFRDNYWGLLSDD